MDTFNLDAYRERLRSSLAGMAQPRLANNPSMEPGQFGPGQGPDPNEIGGPSYPPLGGGPVVEDNLAVPQQQSTPAGPGSAPSLGDAPTGGNLDVQKQEKAKIPIGPPGFKPEFDEKKLKEAKTAQDLFQAMKEDSANDYMSWWEDQYGAIDQKWAQVQKELGKRPDPKRKLDRREQFELLMDFGLNMLRNSSTGDPTNNENAAARSIYDTARSKQSQRQEEVDRYDSLSAQTQKGRQADLAAIGTRGEAMSKQAGITRDLAGTAKDLAPPKETPRNKQIITGVDDTVYTLGDDNSAQPVTGIDGKPIKGRAAGRNGTGSGRETDTRPSQQKQYEHLLTLGIPKEAAVRIAYRQTSGDALKDYKDVYRTTMTATVGDEAAAKRAADAYVATMYGEDAVEKAARGNIIPTGPQKITTQAERDALPPGTQYIAPNGKTYTKR